MRVLELVVSIGLGVLAVLALGPNPALIPALAVAAVAPPLTRVDLAEHRLPNQLVVPALLAGVVGLALSWPVWHTPPIVPLLAAAIPAGVLFVLALFGGMGMGDVKLVAALGLASPTLAIAVLSPLLAFLVGGVAAVIVLISRGRRARIPFGPFLLSGYFGVLTVWALGRVLSPGTTG